MQTLIAANWKMYKTRAQAKETAAQLAALAATPPAGRDVLVFAPFTALAAAVEGMGKSPRIHIGAQDVYPALEGAFTGEISPVMIKDCGCNWVLTGHSERRHVMGESDQLVGRKTAFALAEGLSVVLCIGETLEEREAGKLEAVLRRQLQAGLDQLPANLDPARLAVAYEPVWAIGTGKVASENDIVEAHAMVRALLRNLPGIQADQTPLLYGGSVKPDNASGILALDNVNGLLVGGASLQADTFSKIIHA